MKRKRYAPPAMVSMAGQLPERIVAVYVLRSWGLTLKSIGQMCGMTGVNVRRINLTVADREREISRSEETLVNWNTRVEWPTWWSDPHASIRKLRGQIERRRRAMESFRGRIYREWRRWSWGFA